MRKWRQLVIAKGDGWDSFTKLFNYQIAGEINEQSRALAADLSTLWIKDT